MIRPDYEGARAYALKRLTEDLPARLIYHSLQHTRDDVVPAAKRLAAAEGVNGEDLLLLSTAAYFHDLGFIIRREEHERAGVQIAGQVLPGFNYVSAQIEKICGMIMATRIPQSPTSLMEQILADADLDSLGTERFWMLSQKLRMENEAFEGPMSDLKWYQAQLLFLEQHHYWTSAARTQREAQKQAHLVQLRELLAAATQLAAPHDRS